MKKRKVNVELNYILELNVPEGFPTDEQLEEYRQYMRPEAEPRDVIIAVAMTIGHAGELNPFVEGVGRLNDLGIDWKEVAEDWAVVADDSTN